MDRTSRSLVQRVQSSSEQESWDQLASIYTPLLQRWLQQYELQSNDADDLIQDVLSVVAREVKSFDHNGRRGAFRSWLKTILINRLRNFWRSRNYRPVVGGGSDYQLHLEQLEDPASAVSAVWDREHDQMVLARLRAMIKPRFSEKTYAAFRRQVMDGLSAAEVAEELDMSVNAVLIAKSRVLKELRHEGQGLLEDLD